MLLFGDSGKEVNWLYRMFGFWSYNEIYGRGENVDGRV
jgi:hypothetical protein